MQSTGPDLHRQVVFGESGDASSAAAHPQCWLSGQALRRRAANGALCALSEAEMFRELIARRHLSVQRSFFGCGAPAVHSTSQNAERDGYGDSIHTKRATGGGAAALANYRVGIHVMWPITTEAEMRLATWRAENTSWRWDQGRVRRLSTLPGAPGRADVVHGPGQNQDLFIKPWGAERHLCPVWNGRDCARLFLGAGRFSRAARQSDQRLAHRHHHFGGQRPRAHLPPRLFRSTSCRPTIAAAMPSRWGQIRARPWDATPDVVTFGQGDAVDGLEHFAPAQGDGDAGGGCGRPSREIVLVDGLRPSCR
jgi:hypothetical protein